MNPYLEVPHILVKYRVLIPSEHVQTGLPQTTSHFKNEDARETGWANKCATSPFFSILFESTFPFSLLCCSLWKGLFTWNNSLEFLIRSWQPWKLSKSQMQAHISGGKSPLVVGTLMDSPAGDCPVCW